MSRFNQKYYKRLLESPEPMMYRNVLDLYKEKTLMKRFGVCF